LVSFGDALLYGGLTFSKAWGLSWEFGELAFL
jgi:hypothetical protein